MLKIAQVSARVTLAECYCYCSYPYASTTKSAILAAHNDGRQLSSVQNASDCDYFLCFYLIRARESTVVNLHVKAAVNSKKTSHWVKPEKVETLNEITIIIHQLTRRIDWKLRHGSSSNERIHELTIIVRRTRRYYALVTIHSSPG